MIPTKTILVDENRRTFERHSVIHIPELRGQIDFQNLDSALVDISLGGCRLRYFENPQLRYLKKETNENSEISYITIEWTGFFKGSITFRAQLRHHSEFEIGEILVCEVGYEFSKPDFNLLSPIVGAVAKLD